MRWGSSTGRSDVTVWALGVTAPAYVAEWGLPQTKGGRIRVTEALRVPKHPEIFVAGDLARPLPQLAQPAIQMGEHVGKQILAAARRGRGPGGRPRHPRLRQRHDGAGFDGFGVACRLSCSARAIEHPVRVLSAGPGGPSRWGRRRKGNPLPAARRGPRPAPRR
ncbi:FAD-dependent oxidoreductase [Nonomuraea sp. NPDC003201]